MRIESSGPRAFLTIGGDDGVAVLERAVVVRAGGIKTPAAPGREGFVVPAGPGRCLCSLGTTSSLALVPAGCWVRASCVVAYERGAELIDDGRGGMSVTRGAGVVVSAESIVEVEIETGEVAHVSAGSLVACTSEPLVQATEARLQGRATAWVSLRREAADGETPGPPTAAAEPTPPQEEPAPTVGEDEVMEIEFDEAAAAAPPPPPRQAQQGGFLNNNPLEGKYGSDDDESFNVVEGGGGDEGDMPPF